MISLFFASFHFSPYEFLHSLTLRTSLVTPCPQIAVINNTNAP